MATLICLSNFTDQGIRNIKESPQRSEAFQAMAEQAGVKVKGVYYAVGHYDMVVIVEGPDEAAIATLLKVGSLGNVRTETLRCFSVDEMKKIINSMP